MNQHRKFQLNILKTVGVVNGMTDKLQEIRQLFSNVFKCFQIFWLHDIDAICIVLQIYL